MATVEHPNCRRARQPPEHQETHAVCAVCYQNGEVAVCGTDVSDRPWAPDSAEVTCAVCADLDLVPCSRCGE